MDRGALDHALEGGGGHGFRAFDGRDQRRKIVVDEVDEGLAQLLDVDRAGAHHLDRVRFVEKGEQEMFQRGEFVPVRVGEGQRSMDCLFESVRK